MTKRQRYIKAIKKIYPIGQIVSVRSSSQDYKISNRTVFRFHEWTAEDYNPDFLPDNEDDYNVDFSCHDRGKNTRDINLGSFTRKELSK